VYTWLQIYRILRSKTQYSVVLLISENTYDNITWDENIINFVNVKILLTLLMYK